MSLRVVVASTVSCTMVSPVARLRPVGVVASGQPLEPGRAQRQGITLTVTARKITHSPRDCTHTQRPALGRGLGLWTTRSPYNRRMDRRPLLLRPVSIPDDKSR